MELDCSQVQVSDRVDCGWSGITEAQCLLQECCFDAANSPDCFATQVSKAPCFREVFHSSFRKNKG